MKVPMIAKRAFPYARRSLAAGQEFEADNALDAHVLETVGHAERRTQTYQTRAMTAAPPAFQKPIDYAALDTMDADALRALAARLGVKVHHRTGPEKLRQILRQARA